MPALLSSLLLAAVFVLSVAPNRAGAQPLYYRSIPIGERAIGLGGAYSGIADDPSATYYNPAGLMAGGRFQLLGSLSSFVYTKTKLENAFASGTGSRDFVSDATTTIPHFVGTVIKLGKEKFGDRRFAVAYSSFEVSRERFDAGFSEVRPEGSVDLRINEDYRMRWWGLSFAMQLLENVSLGLSAFLVNQSYGYSDGLGLAFGGTLDENGVRLDGQSVTTTTGIGVGYWGFAFRLGALYRINPKWQIGFMFQPPGAPLKQEGSIFKRLTGDLDAGSVFFLFDEGGLDTRSPLPFELRTGAEYRINALTILSVDVAVTGPVRARNVFDVSGEIESLGLDLGVYFANTTQRRTTPNASIGVEHLFGKAVVAGGLFTNISAAPNLPETSNEFLPEQISMFGASVAVGIDTKGYRLTIGATGYFGRGDAMAFTVNREAEVESYRRTKANRSALVLYVAGAVSVAAKGAKAVQEKYQERKEGKTKEPEGSEQPELPSNAPGPEAPPPS